MVQGEEGGRGGEGEKEEREKGEIGGGKERKSWNREGFKERREEGGERREKGLHQFFNISSGQICSLFHEENLFFPNKDNLSRKSKIHYLTIILPLWELGGVWYSLLNHAFYLHNLRTLSLNENYIIWDLNKIETSENLLQTKINLIFQYQQ